MGVTLKEQGDTSHQNYVKKLRTRLDWDYQVAHKNNHKESEHHKNIMTRKQGA